jgi:hypothetical protein
MDMRPREIIEASLKHGDWVEITTRQQNSLPIGICLDDEHRCQDIKIHSRMSKQHPIGPFEAMIEHHIKEYLMTTEGALGKER